MQEIVASLEKPKVIQLCCGSEVLQASASIGKYRKDCEDLELTCLKFHSCGLKEALTNLGKGFLSAWVMVGAPGVGKSSLRLQFTEGRLDSRLDPYASGGVTSRVLSVGGASVQMMIWERAGCKNLDSLLAASRCGYHGAFVVYDVTRRCTFEQAIDCFQGDEAPLWRKHTIVLLGNKADKDHDRQVAYEEGQDLANALDLLFMEASASAGAMVDEAFQTACEQACLR